MAELSLRSRLVLASGIAVLCSLLVVGAITFALVTRAQLQQVDDTLFRAHPPIEQIADSPDESDWRAIPAIAPGLFVTIIDAQGRALFTAAAIEAGREQDIVDVADIDLTSALQTVQATDGDDIRLRVDRIADGKTLVVGQSLHNVNDTREHLLVVLILASLAAIGAALSLSWWLVRAGLRPLSQVEASAATITDNALSEQRVPGADRATEVGRLATALNAMLDRLQEASEQRESTLDELRVSEARMRRFVADASHELRTPIAATAAYAELFEQGAKDHPDDLERAMKGIRHETGRMGELVDDLLLLARLDEHPTLTAQRVDFTEVVLTAVDAARTVEPDRPIRVRINDVVEVEGDPMRLRQVVDNLLANVRSHTPAASQCDVELAVQDGHALLTITDSGPGVNEQDLPRLFDRFYRVDDARSRTAGGSGLGLSIVQAIVEAHGGAIGAANSELGGLSIEVTLPLSDDE